MATTIFDTVNDISSAISGGTNFLTSVVGRKIEVAYPSATTETYTYKEGVTTLYVLTVTYTDATKASLSSVERTS